MAERTTQSIALPSSPPSAERHRQSYEQDRQTIESFLAQVLPAAHSPQGGCPIPAAVVYSVFGDAQRIRPILALRVARLLEAESDHSLRAAAAVEILHSASLIVDDLPCMDNEAMRRGRPAVHVEFGEPSAMLAAFTMVALAARIVMEAPASPEQLERTRQFQLALLKTLDVSSLVGGQSLDLALSGEAREAQREHMNDLKTVPLFQLAVAAGCVAYPGRPPAELDSFGRRFGLAFQMTDDYLDGELSSFPTLLEQYERCREPLHSFGAAADPLFELVDYLQQRAQAKDHRNW
jgi:geranylgeranyl diphosphate synthase, type II